MKYIYCVVIPLLLQIAIVYTIMVMNTGNGSWVGLAAFLLAIPIITITAIVNTIRTKLKTETKLSVLISQGILVAFIVPVVFLALYVVRILLEGLF